jgi:hypothetical protein
MAETIPFPGWRFLRQFFASFQDVPTTGLHAVGSFVLALLYVTITMVGVILNKPMNEVVIGTIGSFILGYLVKSYKDFAKKRETDRETQVAKVMAARTDPPATITANPDTGTVTATEDPPAGTGRPSQASRVLPADLDQALRAGNGSRPLAPAAPAPLAQDG